jgi:hypothetical protein
MNSSVFWDITPSSPFKVNRRFGEICHPHLQGRSIRQARHQHETGSKQVILHGAIFQKIAFFNYNLIG